MYIGLSQRWGCILLHIAAKAIAGLIAQNGLGWLAGWAELGWTGLAGLGLTDRSQAVGLEFPAPCGCGPWLWAAGSGAAAKKFTAVIKKFTKKETKIN